MADISLPLFEKLMIIENNKREAKKIIKQIKKEIRWVDIKPYSHNIINCLLPELSKYKTEQEMEEFIIETGLRELGW
jgi:hypothetical protein